MLLTERQVSNEATGRILPIDFSHPVSARKVRPGLITRVRFHIYGSQPSPKSPDSASHHVEARAVRMGNHTDGVFAIEDDNILVHNPAVFAT
jgi:hypothetical protein